MIPTRVGRYEVRGQLGEGGMGRVLRGWDPLTGRSVAIKLVRLEEQLREDARTRLLARMAREARALGRLQHPSIITIFDIGEHDGAPFLVMELVEGESLYDRLQRQGPLAVREAARLGAGLARALQHAHERGVLHRDVKPENIVIDRAGLPRLIDFGLAKLALDVEQHSGTRTAPGRMVGTLPFLSPEQIEDATRVGSHSDVWGLGVTLYQCLTGRLPFQIRQVRDLRRIISGAPDAPSSHRPELAGAVDALLLRCLAREPAQRPGAGDLALELERMAELLGGAPARGAAARTRGEAPGEPRSLLQVLEDVMAASLTWSEARDWSGSGPIEEEPAEEEAPTIQVGTALPLPVDQLEVSVLRAQTLFAQGQTRAAVAAFDRALALAPQRAELWAMRGVARRREGDLEGASRDFDAALARDHREPRALVGRGLLHLQQGRTARAVEDLARALELLHPDHPRRADVSTALERARDELRGAGPQA